MASLSVAPEPDSCHPLLRRALLVGRGNSSTSLSIRSAARERGWSQAVEGPQNDAQAHPAFANCLR